MSLQSDFIQYLIALNTAAAARVHDEQVPQGLALPFVATALLTNTKPKVLSGRGLFSRSTLRLAVFGRSATERESIISSVSSDLATKTVTYPAGFTLGTTAIKSVNVSRSSDEVSLTDGDNLIKGAALDLSFMYQE